MNTRAAVPFMIALLAAAGCAHSGPYREGERERGEARLETMIRGKVAGKPQSCISAYLSSHLHVIDRTALVYDAGDTIWVSRPLDPNMLRPGDILVIERTSGQLCKHDIVRTIDQSMHIMTGVVFLGDFVPYR